MYQGDKLIRTLPITNFAGSLKVATWTTIQAILWKPSWYELDIEVAILSLSSRNFELENTKKIAFNDIDSVEFYHKENDQYKRFCVNELYAYGSVLLTSSKSNQVNPRKFSYQFTAFLKQKDKAVYKGLMWPFWTRPESETGYKSGHDFYMLRQSQVSKMSTLAFAGLVDAMKRNMAGNYVLGSWFGCGEVNLIPAVVMLPQGNFTSSPDGVVKMASNMRFTILAKPLLKTSSGSVISNIDFKDVNILGTMTRLRWHAMRMRESQMFLFRKVSVVGSNNVAGLVVNGDNTKITNSFLYGNYPI